MILKHYDWISSLQLVVIIEALDAGGWRNVAAGASPCSYTSIWTHPTQGTVFIGLWSPGWYMIERTEANAA